MSDGIDTALERLRRRLKTRGVLITVERICARYKTSLLAVFSWSDEAAAARQAVVRMLLDCDVSGREIADWFGAEIGEVMDLATTTSLREYTNKPLPVAVMADIMADPRPGREIAREYGLTATRVCRIKREGMPS